MYSCQQNTHTLAQDSLAWTIHATTHTGCCCAATWPKDSIAACRKECKVRNQASTDEPSPTTQPPAIALSPAARPHSQGLQLLPGAVKRKKETQPHADWRWLACPAPHPTLQHSHPLQLAAIQPTDVTHFPMHPPPACCWGWVRTLLTHHHCCCCC